MNNEYRKQFCKINNLPIKMFESPVFESRISLMDKQYNTFELLRLFESEISEFKNIEEYLAFYNQFKETVITHITNKDSYKEFNSKDFNIYKNSTSSIRKQSLYQPSRDGKYFLSFDLTEANFNAMKYFDNDLIDGKDSYEEFISQFTDKQHLIKSKYVRQVIFGTCNPSRQATIEKYLMTLVYNEVSKKYDDSYIVHFSEDEIVLELKEDPELEKNVLSIAKENGFKIKVEKFKLIKIDGTDGYIKVRPDNSIKLKCANALMVPFIIRTIENSETEELDKVFIHEGFQCKFVEAPTISVPELNY